MTTPQSLQCALNIRSQFGFITATKPKCLFSLTSFRSWSNPPTFHERLHQNDRTNRSSSKSGRQLPRGVLVKLIPLVAAKPKDFFRPSLFLAKCRTNSVEHVFSTDVVLDDENIRCLA